MGVPLFHAGLLAVSMVLGSATCRAAAPPTMDPVLARRVDDAVLRVIKEDRAPSASIAVVRDGRLVYAAAYGHARLSPAIAATPETRYQLASLSKMLTANVLLMLEEDGQLSLDDPVARWLPTLTGGERVTVRELLQHTSGYPDHYPQLYPAGPRALPTTPDQIIAEWGRHPLLFEPGTRFRYSNLNYVMAGRIAEKAAGEPLYAMLQRLVFTPLGMQSTADLDAVGPLTPNLAIGYLRPALGNLQAAPEEGRGWSFGAGQVVATASDVAHWDERFLAGGLLAPHQSQEQVTPPTLADGSRSPYALGLFVSTRGGRTLFYHVGQGLGFLTVNRIYPAERCAIVVLTNDSSSSAFAHIAQRLEYLIVPPTPADVQARAVFRAIQRNDLDRQQASSDFNAYFDARMARTYADSLAPLGEPDSFELRDEDQADGLTTRVYEISAGGRRLKIVEQVLSDGHIESFSVQAAG